MDLTSKQLLVLDFIKQFIATRGYSPTVREIADGLCLRSPATVQNHLKRLVSRGLIKIDKRKSRTIELLVQNEYLKDSSESINVPILKEGPDSIPTETLEIPLFLLNDYDPKNIYIYKENRSIFLVNISLTIKEKPSVVIKGNTYSFEEKPKDVSIFGNVIGEYRFY